MKPEEKKAAALEIYLNLGKLESLPEVSKLCTEKYGKGFSPRTVRRWAEVDNWQQILRNERLSLVRRQKREEEREYIASWEELQKNESKDYRQMRAVINMLLNTAFVEDKETGLKVLKKSVGVFDANDLVRTLGYMDKINKMERSNLDKKVFTKPRMGFLELMDLEEEAGNMTQLESLTLRRKILEDPLNRSDINLAEKVDQNNRKIPNTATPELINEAWARFQDQTREDCLSAIDFCFELERLGLEPPTAVLEQAKQELKATEEEEDYSDIEDFDYDTLQEEHEKYKEYHKKELEEFLPEREQEIKDLHEELGFNTGEKPASEILEVGE